MELSVLPMGSRKCFVVLVGFIVGWDDPHLEEHFGFCGDRDEGLCNQQLTQVRKRAAGMRGYTK